MEGIGLTRNILRFSEAEAIFNYLTLIVIINILIFVSWVLIMALKDPGIFTGIYSDTQLIRSILKGSNTGENGSMENGSEPESGEVSPLVKRLKEHMETREPFMDASLSVHDLARQLEMNTRDLSLLINHTLDQHFFDFVNRYRINKAKEMLSDSENSKVTVLEVLYEVGFNSKSSFNTTFKKFTGQTPTQFRRSQI
jgi:AraC-like DNA-binding protein